VEEAKESTIGPRYNVAKAATAPKAKSLMTEIVDKAQIDKTISESDKIVVVMIKAKWCRLCNSMKQPIDRLVKKHGYDNAEYCLVDFNNCQDYCK
jgi:thiol:disulfide interchange protein